MRRGRRGGHGGPEFGGSGEDSFVAVVVTKLTGALLFILLLTMVIMALLPKAVDRQAPTRDATEPPSALEIATPAVLPEAIAGRPYTLALAATGGRGPLRWSIDGPLPDGLTFDAQAGIIRGTPGKGTPKPVPIAFRVADATSAASRTASLVVYESDRPLATPSQWMPKLPPVPWRAWMDRGFGFLVLLLVHMVGMNALAGVEQWARRDASDESNARLVRFRVYRSMVRLASLAAAVALAVWLARQHGA